MKSLMLTVVSVGVPADTPSGRVPKASFTLSPPSFADSGSSTAAENVNDFEVSPLSKLTLAGTPA